MDENLYLFWSREKLVQNNELQDLRMIWNFVTLSLISRLEYFIPVHKLSEPYQINTFLATHNNFQLKQDMHSEHNMLYLISYDNRNVIT